MHVRIRSVRRDVLVWMELGYEVGCFSEFLSLELYAEVFESIGCLDKLEAFAS